MNVFLAPFFKNRNYTNVEIEMDKKTLMNLIQTEYAQFESCIAVIADNSYEHYYDHTQQI